MLLFRVANLKKARRVIVNTKNGAQAFFGLPNVYWWTACIMDVLVRNLIAAESEVRGDAAIEDTRKFGSNQTVRRSSKLMLSRISFLPTCSCDFEAPRIATERYMRVARLTRFKCLVIDNGTLRA